MTLNDFICFYVVIACFMFVFNLNWMVKEEIKLKRFLKYNGLAIVWPYQLFLQLTNRTI